MKSKIIFIITITLLLSSFALISEFLLYGGMYSRTELIGIEKAISESEVIDCEWISLYSGEAIFINTYFFVNPFSKYNVHGGKLIPRKYNDIIESKLKDCIEQSPFKQ